jgi:hypothetical protein
VQAHQTECARREQLQGVSGNGDGVLGLGSEVLGEIRLQKAEGNAEGQEKRKELEFKMSYGDKRLKDREM